MEQKTYTLTLEQGDLAVIGAALAKLPYEVVAGLLAKIGKQVESQNEPPIDWQKPVITADGEAVEVLGTVEIHGGAKVMRVRLKDGEALYPTNGRPGADWLPALRNRQQVQEPSV